MSTPHERRLDGLGRVVIPMDIRRRLSIAPGDRLDVSCEDGRIVIARVGEACVVCHTAVNLVTMGSGALLCTDCAAELRG